MENWIEGGLYEHTGEWITFTFVSMHHQLKDKQHIIIKELFLASSSRICEAMIVTV